MDEDDDSIGRRIADWMLSGLEKPGKTQKGLATAMGVHPSTITMILRGGKDGKRRHVKFGEVAKMAEYLELPSPYPREVNVELFENMERMVEDDIKKTIREHGHEHLDSFDVAALLDKLPEKQVPVVGYVGAGAEAHYYAVGSEGDLDRVRAPKSASDKTVALEIRGSSLGEVFNRWLVFYDDIRAPITDDLIGQLCIVALPDDRLLVKKIERDRNGGIILKSNTEEPIEVDEIVWAARVTHMEPR